MCSFQRSKVARLSGPKDGIVSHQPSKCHAAMLKSGSVSWRRCAQGQRNTRGMRWNSMSLGMLQEAKSSVVSWDALWVDPVHSDDHYCLPIPPLFQSDLVCLLNRYSFILFL